MLTLLFMAWARLLDETHRVENCPLRFMLLFRLEATCV